MPRCIFCNPTLRFSQLKVVHQLFTGLTLNSCPFPRYAAMSYRMAVAVDSESAFRVERAENSRLAWAFAFSLILHLVVFGGYRAGNQLGWWQRLELPSWMKPTKMLADLAKRHEPPPPQQPEEVPLVFVEVSPAQATPEPPKEAKFYSDKNSIAANPEPD